MKITRSLRISKEEFFEQIIDNLAIQYMSFENKVLLPEQIKKGLQFTQHPEDVYKRVRYELSKYEENASYCLIARSYSDVIRISFEVEEQQKGIKVTFNQSLQSFESKKHNRFLKAFYEINYLGRMSDTLFDIQKKAEAKAQ